MATRQTGRARRALALMALGVTLGAHGAQAQEPLWTDPPQTAREQYLAARRGVEPVVNPTAYRLLDLNASAMASLLSAAPQERLDLAPAARPAAAQVTLPAPDGRDVIFDFVESSIMDPALQAQFPDIRTYVGQAVDEPGVSVRFDSTPLGFHAQVLDPERGTWYIDPYIAGETYASWWRRDAASPEEWHCGVDSATQRVSHPAGETPALQRSGSQLRTFRLALACTGEYAAFFGGTVSGAMAGMVTTMNRVDGIYEVELSCRMVLIANDNLLVFTNASTDGYTNDDGGAMLDENQTKIDSIIGNANYDIGHVFSTGGGGVAYLGIVCETGIKAGGVTGSPSPTGDAYDVDYVAHEMGHQFGANHTFNSETDNCGGGNREATAAYEPGSGSTIMAYAGICGADDLQPHSDPYFHFISFDEIIASIPGYTCAVTTSTGNTAPTANAGADYSIPKGTPFTLTGSGNDVNAGQTLTYCWEQRDLGNPQTLAAADNGSSPLFRSFNPTTSPSRTCPRWSVILANTADNQEKVPQLARTMDWRLTVRDNFATGGGVNTDDMVVTVVATAGPFAVTAPTTSATLVGGVPMPVTWSVANTTAAPINTANVNILLSTDGGNTWPTTLAANTPNDGSQPVTLPNISTTQARVMVAAAGNIYFDVSNVNFTIVPNTGQDFAVTATEVDFGRRDVADGPFTDSATQIGLIHPFTLSSVAVNGASAGEFTLTGPAALPLAISADTPLTFRWAPSTGDGVTREVTAHFTGTGTPAAFDVVLRGVATTPPVTFDASGYKVEQINSAFTLIIPNGTTVQPGGFIVIGRQSTLSEFEAFWGVTLGADVVYINGFDLIAPNGFPQINGSEQYRLLDPSSVAVDPVSNYFPGTNISTGLSYLRTATDGTAFTSVPRDNATPGTYAGTVAHTGKLVITEFSDASTFNNEFVELYYDAPSAPAGLSGFMAE